ncbi:hypothetical protein AE32_03477 [Acinetobacter nosocomialis]|uniref:Transposase DDE domain-containing protein n=1 Tax=Acinetobacter nosocomialis TaxID=106654 RepID=A0A836MHZ1_ACINO|nr:hypothetical protein AE32_03477 [Acinetobacter nosocomialis]
MSRGNIAIWFDPATQWYAPSKGKQGRNQTYSDAAIQCCLMIKSLFRLSLRMVTVIYAELSGDFPLGDSRQPTYKSLRPFDLVS